MKRFSINQWCRGASLVEALIALGVLAVALPLVAGALAEAGKCGCAAQAETRSLWIIPACLAEIRASREGRSRYFPATSTGQTFPPPGTLWALAFGPDGKMLGSIPPGLHDRGLRELDGLTVSYVAKIGSSPAVSPPGAPPMVEVHISLEYPASAPAAQRRQLGFHTRMP